MAGEHHGVSAPAACLGELQVVDGGAGGDGVAQPGGGLIGAGAASEDGDCRADVIEAELPQHFRPLAGAGRQQHVNRHERVTETRRETVEVAST